jgi:hypothetical protein
MARGVPLGYTVNQQKPALCGKRCFFSRRNAAFGYELVYSHTVTAFLKTSKLFRAYIFYHI